MDDQSLNPDSMSGCQIRDLYRTLLSAWNHRSAKDFAALLTADCWLVGFDGSTMNGPAEVEGTLGEIFAHHPTAAYVSKVRGVRFVSSSVAILNAVAGMVPPGKNDLNPAVNAVQTLVAEEQNGEWRIALFQNTPAAFHGRPQLSEQLTEELRQVLKDRPSE